LKLIVVLVCLIGGLVGYFLSNWRFYFISKLIKFILLVWFSGSIWFLPFLSTSFIVYFPLYIGFNYIKFIDLGWLENLGGQNINKILINNISNFLQNLQNNRLKLFFILFLLWVIVYILII